jgi:hypothetical protein
VSQAGAENAAVQAYAREDAEGLILKVALFEGELAVVSERERRD